MEHIIHDDIHHGYAIADKLVELQKEFEEFVRTNDVSSGGFRLLLEYRSFQHNNNG